MRKLSSFLRIIALVVCLCLLTACGSAAYTPAETGAAAAAVVGHRLLSQIKAGETLPEDSGTYTLMCYMVGSNLETDGACASTDICEMIDSGLDFSKVNVLVYLGGAQTWHLDGIPQDRNCVIQLTEGGYTIVGETSGHDDTGDPEVFSDFLNWCCENYPADQYGLICWDHGGGPVFGYGSDEFNDDDGLSMAEFRTAMDSTQFNSENKLAFIGYDACLMASLEVADLWKDYADYLIASTESELGDGWDYSFLSVMNTTTDTLTIAKAAVDAFEAYYAAYYDERYADMSDLELSLLEMEGAYPYATLSCMDLSQAETCMNKLDSMMSKMADEIDTCYPAVEGVRTTTKSYCVSLSTNYDLIDLTDFVSRLPAEYRSILSVSDLSKLVVYSTTNAENSYGVSLYFPRYYEALYNEAAYGHTYYSEYLDTCAPDGYRRFLEKYTALAF